MATRRERHVQKKTNTLFWYFTNDINQRIKLIDILTHDVQRIERLITDYSQILKDEVALSKEKIKKIDNKMLFFGQFGHDEGFWRTSQNSIKMCNMQWNLFSFIA